MDRELRSRQGRGDGVAIGNAKWLWKSNLHDEEVYTYTKDTTYRVVFTGNPETAEGRLMIYQFPDHEERLIHSSYHYPVSAAMEYAEKLTVTSDGKVIDNEWATKWR